MTRDEAMALRRCTFGLEPGRRFERFPGHPRVGEELVCGGERYLDLAVCLEHLGRVAVPVHERKNAFEEWKRIHREQARERRERLARMAAEDAERTADLVDYLTPSEPGPAPAAEPEPERG